MREQHHSPLTGAITATLPHANVDTLLASVKYYVDEEVAHLKIKDEAVCAGCEARPCLYFCPAGVFSLDNRHHIQVSYQACVECGSCRIGCPHHNVDWHLPRGGYGVAYKFG